MSDVKRYTYHGIPAVALYREDGREIKAGTVPDKREGRRSKRTWWCAQTRLVRLATGEVINVPWRILRRVKDD